MNKNRSLEDAIEDFPETPMVMVLIGTNGCERVWLDHEIQTEAQHEWAAKHVMAAASIARRMQTGAGSA